MPVALAIESRGYEVIGYDTNPAVAEYVANREYPFQEKGLPELLSGTRLEVTPSLGKVVLESDIIFLPVQTPHEPQYEGSTRLPTERADFDYRYLRQAIGAVAIEATKAHKQTTLAVISTCLPGTYNERIKPFLDYYGNVDYVYTPQFIAMGNVIEDYLWPEFNLIGVESERAADQLERFYATINDAPNIRTDITTAEGIKMSYNTWITAKTVLANAWGEMAHRMGMDFDDIHKAWTLATDRIISPRYMDSGVGDGGGCHPRDNIALSYLAEKINMSHNIWEDLMKAREDHMTFIADTAIMEADNSGLPIYIMGEAFKPGTNIKTGSPAVLLANIIAEFNDVTIIPDFQAPIDKGVYVVGVKHDDYREFKFPDGSVVIDPFRYLPESDNIKLIQIGKNKNDRRPNSR